MSIFDAFRPQTKATVLPPVPGFAAAGIPTTYTAQRTGKITDAYADASFVYEIVADLATKASTLPVKVYQYETDGRSELPNHPAYKLLRRPSDFYNRVEFLEFLFANRLLWGEYVIAKIRDSRNRVIQLWPLRSDRIKEVPDPDTGALLGWILNYNSETPTPLLPEDVIFAKRYHPTNDYRGMSSISALRYQIELGRDAESANIDFWANSAMPRGVLQLQKKMGEGGIKRLAVQFRELLQGSGNRYKIPILEEGMDYKSIQLNPADAEFINTANLSRGRVADAYGYTRAEDYPNASPDELRRARYANGVQPLTVALEEALEHSLMPEFGVGAFPEFGLSHILDADFPTLVSALKDAVLAGIMTPNAAGAKINQPPVEGGDERFVPLNLEALSNIVNDGNATPRAADSGGGLGGDEGRTGSRTGTASFKRVGGYRTARERRISKLSKALDNRIRGILKTERRDLLGGKAASFTQADVVDLVRKHSEDLARLLEQFLTQAHQAGLDDASLISGNVAEVTAPVFGSRAEDVARVFASERTSTILALLDQMNLGEIDSAAMAKAVGEAYGGSFSSWGTRIATTEIAYAHELAARSSWSEMGAPFMTWNFGGGPCTTGACEEADGQEVDVTGLFVVGEFGDLEGPPAHNYCTCYTTPSWGDATVVGAVP